MNMMITNKKDSDHCMMIIFMIMVMTILTVSILQETDGVLLESYLIYEPEHQVIIILFSPLRNLIMFLNMIQLLPQL